jgi:hypothetical protein
MGPLPTLFVGVGPCAQETLRELSRLAQCLTAPIQGPFGLVLADTQGEGLFACEWAWAFDIQAPDVALLRERSEFIGRDEERLVVSLSSLVRRLHSIEPAADPAPGSRLRVSAYVAIDLSEDAAVASAVRLMRVLRRVDAAMDMTVLGLTARTAARGCVDDAQWFETWKLLLEQLQDGLLAQRVYLLDGCNADKVWFERPEQLHRLGAEFLLYHGITCRGLLRQNERARTGAQEGLLNVCGSFGCRTIEADLSVVAERIAQRLAREDLLDLYQRTVPRGWFANLQEQARLLVDRIATICERAYQAKASASAGGRDRTDACRSENAEIADAIRKTIKQVCAREPLISLCLFFQDLRPRLARLLTRQRLWERARTRLLAAEAFHRQVENTYEPMRVWLSRPETRWTDRFTPVQQEAPDVAVSRPAGRKSCVAGALFLAIGLVGAAAGIASHDRLLAAGAGLVSIAASVLMALPIGWTLHPRNQLCGGQEGDQDGEQRTRGRGQRAALRPGSSRAGEVPPVSYRKGASGSIRLVSVALILVGLAGVTRPLWPDAWTLTTRVWAVMLVALAGIGLACVAGCPNQRRPDQVRRDEAPGHAGPPVWWCPAVGLVCLALAWAVLCLVTPAQMAADAIGPWSALVAGLVLVAGGVGLGLFPRTGRLVLVDRVARVPQPLTGGIAHPVKERELPRSVVTLAAWVHRLTLDPDQCLERFGATDGRPARETLLDFLALDWESQLARAFRQAVEARAGKSLKTLALQPMLWAECIARQVQNPQEGGGELTTLFALQAVRAWIESHPLSELLSLLDVDLARFGGLVGRLAPPHWPTPRVDPDINVSVIAVGKPLWGVVAPLARRDGKKVGSEEGRNVPPSGLRTFVSSSSGISLALLDWDSRDDRIVVLRVVQGLTQGWRGLPGMPGLRQESSRTAPVQA